MRIKRIVKKITAIAVTAAVVIMSAGCASVKEETKKIKICATLFPQYDFCRVIGGDNAEVTLILPPGMESHSFEPSVSDVLSISACDIFVYTGSAMEPWAETVISSIDTDVYVVDASQGIELIEHSHGIGFGHDDDDDDDHDGEEHEVDPHIWTSPVNAAQMVDTITDALCRLDSANSGIYMARASQYKSELYSLDDEFFEIAENAETTLVCHGGRFSMNYFAKRYGFEFVAAFDSCSSQAEPSMARLTDMIEIIRENNIKAVFYEELTEPKTARVLAEETGTEILLLHTCHNVSKAELEAGATYLSLMKQNAANLRKALL